MIIMIILILVCILLSISVDVLKRVTLWCVLKAIIICPLIFSPLHLTWNFGQNKYFEKYLLRLLFYLRMIHYQMHISDSKKFLYLELSNRSRESAMY